MSCGWVSTNIARGLGLRYVRPAALRWATTMAAISFKNFLKKHGATPELQERQKDGKVFHTLFFGDGIYVSRKKGDPDLSLSWLNANFQKLVVMEGTTTEGNPCYTIVESQFENHDVTCDFTSLIG